MKSLFLGLVVLGWVLTGFFGWSQYQQNQQMKASLDGLEEQVELLKSLATSQQEKLQRLEDRSIESIVDGTSQSLLDTWEALVDGVEQELERAQDVIKEIYNEKGQSQQDSQPQLESDDGTERI